jgi:hypothetical protein
VCRVPLSIRENEKACATAQAFTYFGAGFPQGLKPMILLTHFGPAKAVPLLQGWILNSALG